MDQAIELAKTSDSIIIILLVVMAILVVALIPVMKNCCEYKSKRGGIRLWNHGFKCLLPLFVR